MFEAASTHHSLCVQCVLSKERALVYRCHVLCNDSVFLQRGMHHDQCICITEWNAVLVKIEDGCIIDEHLTLLGGAEI